MEININCDLGETSKFCSTENDPLLLGIVNSANIACGYHAGDEETMNMVIKISKSKLYQELDLITETTIEYNEQKNNSRKKSFNKMS